MLDKRQDKISPKNPGKKSFTPPREDPVKKEPKPKKSDEKKN